MIIIEKGGCLWYNFLRGDSVSIPSPMVFVTIINIGFMLLVVFVQRRNTAATWAWLAAVALVPIGGFVMYMVLGQDSRKQKVFLKKTEDDELLLASYQGMGANEGEPTYDNKITVFHDGASKFDALLVDIAGAKDFIFAQYYIIRGDEVAQQFIAALAERARAGVEVWLLSDGMGCHYTPEEVFKPLLDAGGKLGLFMPPVPVRINFRNHRKIVVIDGKLSYLGGSNIGREYVSQSERFGFWRETHMRLAGGAIAPLALRFIMDWNCDSTEKAEKIQLNPRYFPKSPSQEPGARVTVVSSGPDTRYPNVLHSVIRMIMDAKESIYIQSPYFVPDDALFTALRIAALSGVDVRIMYPANPDHPFVYWAGSSYVGELMCAGVRGYEYTNGFIHSKAIMVDSKICAMGTANMDVRSFKINFETHAFIEDADITRELEEAFFRDMQASRALTLEEYNARPRRTKIKESISRLFSPLL